MFDAKYEKEKIIDFIKDFFNKNNLGGVVIVLTSPPKQILIG